MGTDYDRWEMATQILTPSYISLESALLRYGMIYQTISHITLISYKTCHLMVDDTLLDIHMVKRSILLCSQGISHDGTTSIASPERAFLDTLYLYRDFAFDHLDMIDWSRVDELLPLYDSLILIQRIRQYRQKLIAHNYA